MLYLSICKMDYSKVYTFTGTLSNISSSISYKGIFIPPEVLSKLPIVKGRIRVKGTINGHPFNLAIQSAKEAGKYFMISGPLRKACKLEVGPQPIAVSFSLVDSDELEIPEELLSVLEQDEVAGKIFYAYTKGYQRSLVHYITTVKNIDSRIKRALELAEKIKIRTFHIHKNKEE